MKWLKLTGPPRGMDADEAPLYALAALYGWWVWHCVFEYYGQAWALSYDKLIGG